MGIEECVQRHAAGYGITVEELAGWTKQDLLDRLKQIRKEYTERRAKILGIYSSNPYNEMLYNETVLENFVEEVKENVKLLSLVDADRKWLEEFQNLIFETGQGLLLDQDYEAYAPHLEYLLDHKIGTTLLRHESSGDLFLPYALLTK